MRALVCPVIVLIALVAARPADAKVHTLEAAQVSIDVPKGWSVAAADLQLTLTSPDATVTVALGHIQAGGIDQAWLTFGDELAKAGFPLGEPAARTYGAFSGTAAEVMGGMAGFVAIVETHGGNGLAIVAMALTDAYQKHAKAVEKMLGTLRSTAPVLAEAELDGMPAAARKAAVALATALDTNNVKAFLKLVGKSLQVGGDLDSPTYKKAKLKPAIAKAGSIAAFLGLPASGAWHVRFDASSPDYLRIYRGEWGVGTWYVAVNGKKQKKYLVSGTGVRQDGEVD
jgi:hypothetical protein